MTTQQPIAELEAERDFLLNALRPPPSGFGGSSSNMLFAAITDTEPDSFHHPFDKWDWEGVEETYERAPAHLKPKLRAILDQWRADDEARDAA